MKNILDSSNHTKHLNLDEVNQMIATKESSRGRKRLYSDSVKDDESHAAIALPLGSDSPATDIQLRPSKRTRGNTRETNTNTTETQVTIMLQTESISNYPRESTLVARGTANGNDDDATSPFDSKHCLSSNTSVPAVNKYSENFHPISQSESLSSRLTASIAPESLSASSRTTRDCSFHGTNGQKKDTTLSLHEPIITNNLAFSCQKSQRKTSSPIRNEPEGSSDIVTTLCSDETKIGTNSYYMRIIVALVFVIFIILSSLACCVAYFYYNEVQLQKERQQHQTNIFLTNELNHKQEVSNLQAQLKDISSQSTESLTAVAFAYAQKTLSDEQSWIDHCEAKLAQQKRMYEQTWKDRFQVQLDICHQNAMDALHAVLQETLKQRQQKQFLSPEADGTILLNGGAIETTEEEVNRVPMKENTEAQFTQYNKRDMVIEEEDSIIQQPENLTELIIMQDAQKDDIVVIEIMHEKNDKCFSHDSDFPFLNHYPSDKLESANEEEASALVTQKSLNGIDMTNEPADSSEEEEDGDEEEEEEEEGDDAEYTGVDEGEEEEEERETTIYQDEYYYYE